MATEILPWTEAAPVPIQASNFPPVRSKYPDSRPCLQDTYNFFAAAAWQSVKNGLIVTGVLQAMVKRAFNALRRVWVDDLSPKWTKEMSDAWGELRYIDRVLLAYDLLQSACSTGDARQESLNKQSIRIKQNQSYSALEGQESGRGRGRGTSLSCTSSIARYNSPLVFV